MSKLAVILLIFATAAMYWHKTDAKPFLFLPANFFVLTTRAPTTDSKISSTSYSSPSTSSTCGDFISRKLSFITNLLSGFGTNGGIGGSFGVGFNFNAEVTTHRPTTTTSRGITDPDTIFTPDVTTKSPETPSKASSTTEKTSVATSTEKSEASTQKSEVSTETEAIAVTTIETTSIKVQPTVVPQFSASTSTTKNNIEYNVATTQITNMGDGNAVTDAVGSNFDVPTVDNKQDIKKAETMGDGVSGYVIDIASGSVGGVISSGVSGSGFRYETQLPDIDNEIFSGNIKKTYLPVPKEQS